MENIGYFTDFVTKYGIPDQYKFVTNDLFTQANMNQVTNENTTITVVVYSTTASDLYPVVNFVEQSKEEIGNESALSLLACILFLRILLLFVIIWEICTFNLQFFHLNH